MAETAQTTTAKNVLAEKDGAIGWMIFNNPARHNAMTLEMWASIAGILDDFEADDDVRVVVLRGMGDRAFVSGADISQFEKVRSNAEQTRKYDATTEVATSRLFNCPKPTIAMVHGYCIGGGVSLAMSCDLRIVSDKARFGVPAAKLSVGYQPHALKKLIDVVGPAFAMEIFYTARQFSAEEALAMGWVNRVLPADGLEDYVRDYAATIGGNAPLTIRAVKRTVKELLRDAGERDLDAAKKLVEACFSSEDYVEGRRAFMEKRKPAFKGR